jgi:DNA-binding response OmpR family regulator
MAGKTILIADDDPEMLKALSIQLKREGYGVLTAPDLLIPDTRMPTGGGLSVLEKLGGSILRNPL